MGCSPWGRQESDTTERLHFHFSLSCIGEGNGNPLQCSCLHTGFSRGRSGGLVFPSLSEVSTVYCDPHSQRVWHSQYKTRPLLCIRRGCVVGPTPGPHRAGVWGPGSKPSPTWGRMHQKDPCHFPPGGGPRTRQQRRPEAGRGRVAVAAGKCSPGRGWHASCLHLATGLLWGLGCPQYGPVPMASLSRLTQGCSDGHCGPTGSIYFSYSSFPGGLLSGDDGRTAPEPDP